MSDVWGARKGAPFRRCQCLSEKVVDYSVKTHYSVISKQDRTTRTEKEMSEVKNEHGVSIDFEAAVALMDDEVREQVHADVSPCTEQEFFDKYCAAHREKFGEDFEPAKAHAQW